MNSLLNQLAGILLSQSVQIGLVFLIVMSACALLRRASAHWRYLLWLLVIAKCLTPPIITFSLPVLPAQELADTRSNAPVQFGIVREQSAETETNDSYHTASRGSTNTAPTIDEPIASHTASGSIEHQSKAKSRIASLGLQHWLALAWLAGVALFLLIMVAKAWATHRTIVGSRVMAQKAMQEVLCDLVRTSGLKRSPRLYEVDFAAQPFVWGWLGGDIYVSPSFSGGCSREKCRSIIAHELAHVSRWDAAVNHLQNVVQALFFFHPLVWIANRRLRVERERCCDEAVLSDLANRPSVYAEAIIDTLTHVSESGKATPALAVTGSIEDIKTRIVAILTPNRSFLRRPSKAAIITFFTLAACVLPTFVVLTRVGAADDDRNKQINSVGLQKFSLRFADETGKPVQNVRVTAAGVRCKEDPASGYSWPKDLAPTTEYISDANGEVEVDYPNKFCLEANAQGLTTTKLIFRIKHEEYISLGDVEVDITVKSLTRTLERGCQVALTCRGPDGLMIKDFSNVMPGWDREIWRLQDGKLHSGSLPVGSTQTMLAVPAADGKHLFSEPFDLLCSRENVFTSEIVVQPGMVLRGKLADNVPRPIELGKVIAFCVPRPLGPSVTTNPSVSWTDEAIISADGSFEFASLPPSESIQLIALCRGWVTDQWRDSLARGEVLELDKDQVASREYANVTLTMEKTGSIEVLVLDQVGNPIVGADVCSWLNQAYSHDFGTTLFGYCYKSIELAKSQIAGEPAPIANLNGGDRYNAVTDNEGKAVLHEIRLNQPQFLYAFHDDFVLQENEAEVATFRGLNYQCTSPDRKKLTVQMVRPKKTESSALDASTAPRGASGKKFVPTVLNSKVVKFEVDLLGEDQFVKLMQKRTVSVSPVIRKAILGYADGIHNPNPQAERAIKDLREGKDGLTLDAFLSILVVDNPVAIDLGKQLRGHDDPVVRFAANLALANIAADDITAAQALHELVHDESLQKADRQLICTWCSGVGIRADDTAEQIQHHFATVTSEEVKLKPGELAPEFEFASDTGTTINSKELRGKTIVLHFWATSCGPCMGQMSEHIKSLTKLDQGHTEVLFVSLDNDEEKFNEAVNKFQIPFKNLRDERGWGGDLVRAFGVRYMPFDVIIGPDGKIISNSIDDLKHLMK